jgi:serine/threonine protein kinase
MNPERWNQITGIFQAAIERDASTRALFVAEKCGGDSELKQEVEKMLAAHDDAGSFIESSAGETAAQMIDESNVLENGKRLAHYRIVRQLGAGGMGEVYLAEDTKLGRQVALKILPAQALMNRDNLRRFEQEARSASRLNHANIAHIYEIGETGGLHFIAMEYVEGESLADKINGRPLSVSETVEIGAQIADALEEAHSAGIVHRDIKSDNVMITRRGRVKVLDFGLAKISSKIESEESTRVKTAPGVVMGTVHYMSPEQSMGQAMDFRTDIWSLGVILYEMATGRLPFQGASITETIDQIAHAQPPAIARFNYDVPAELEVIIKKCLRKKREERYASARDLRIDLENLKRELDLNEHSFAPETSREIPANDANKTLTFKQQTDETTAPVHAASSAEYLVTEIKRHKLGSAVAFLVLALVLGGLGYGLFRLVKSSGGQTTAANPAPAAIKVQPLTANGNIPNAAISPDGKFLAYVQQVAGGQQSLWTKQISTNSNLQIVAPTSEPFFAVTFSPDGEYVFYVLFDDGTIYRVPKLGGASVKIASDTGSPISFSPDGKQIVFEKYDATANEYSLIIINSDGTNARKLAARGGHEWFSSGISWSADGKLIACATGSDNFQLHQTLAVVAVESGEVKEFTEQRWDSIRRVAWLPDGSGILFTASDKGANVSKQIWEISYPEGKARALTHDLTDYQELSLTADSKTLIAIQYEQSAHVFVSPNADVNKAEQVSKSKNEGAEGMTLTPDGRIVYISHASGATEIWIINKDGSNAQQLTNDGVSKYTPAVSSDGRYIIFASERPEQHIWRINLDGSQPVQLTNGKDEGNPRISSDGKWVVYSSYNSGSLALWRIPIEGGEPQKLTDFTATEPDVSPDGKFIACFFVDESSKRWQLGIIPFDGGKPVKTFDVPPTVAVDNSPQWMPDGRGITYIDGASDISNLWLQPTDGGAPKQLTNYKQGYLYRREWTRDGKQIAIVRGTETSDAVMITDFR